jgi:O-antigen/teichoic acid export membrane protein
VSTAGQPGDLSRLQARRRQARRRRNLARLDVGLGLACAVVLILATPGLAITALVALLVLVVCGVSFALERSLTRRSARDPSTSEDAAPDGRPR